MSMNLSARHPRTTWRHLLSPIAAGLLVACLGLLWASPVPAARSISLSALNVTQLVPGPGATFTLTWSPPGPALTITTVIYESSPTATAFTPIAWLSPSTFSQPFTRTTIGKWQYRVQYEAGPNVLGFSNVVGVTVLAPTASPPPTPTLFAPGRPPLAAQGFSLQWTNDPADFIYELREDTVPDFSTPGAPDYWPTANSEPIPPKPAGTYFYRVRAWSQLPENGGASSGWSNVITVQVLTDDAFLDDLARKTFDYFIASTLPNGLTLDRLATDGTSTDIASIAASGFYLSALTIGAERGWMTWQEAHDRAKTTLEMFQSGTPNVNGFFYHFLHADGSPSDVPFLEVSSIDTALLLAGTLQAGEYFGGEIKTLADTMYRRVDWTWMYDPTLNFMRWGWVDEVRGFYEGGYYDSTSEAILLYLLAIGSPTNPIPAESFYSFARPKGNYRGPDFSFTTGGQLFTYQYAQAWYDFRNTTDAIGVNWWQNSIEAARANQRFAIDNPGFGYNEFVWGLTSCDGPNATPENPNGYTAYGALPAYSNIHDGTIAPTGIGASVAMVPDIAIPSLKYLYAVHGDQLWTPLGFVDAFNLNLGWVDTYYIGIDQGALLLMLENHRSELIWQHFMANEHVQRSLARAKFSGYVADDVLLEDFEDQAFWTPETTVGWWDSAGTHVYQRSNEYATASEGQVAMRINYSKNGDAWSLMGAYVSPSNPLRDFTGHELVTLDVHGDAEVLVKLRDASQAEEDVAIRRGPAANAWNRLVFDYSTLGVNTSAIDNLLFFVDPGNATSRGTVVFDAIRLENRKPVVVEDFEDGSFWTPDTSLGWWDIDGTRVYRRAPSKDPSLGGVGAMQVEYTKDGLPWSLFAGHLSPSNPLRDFTQRTRLVVSVSGEAELLVKLRDRSLREVELGRATATNPTGWSRLVFEYAGVNDVDLTDIDNILFFVAPGEPWTSGTIYLDDILLD